MNDEVFRAQPFCLGTMKYVETRYIASFRKRCVTVGIARVKSQGSSGDEAVASDD